jgi:hypothetical protein
VLLLYRPPADCQRQSVEAADENCLTFRNDLGRPGRPDFAARRDAACSARGNRCQRHAGRADEALLHELIERHLRFTGSTVARALLDGWEAARTKFVKVFPHEYKRALAELNAASQAASA